MLYSTALLSVAIPSLVCCHPSHQNHEQAIAKLRWSKHPSNRDGLHIPYWSFKDPAIAAAELRAQQSLTNPDSTLVPFIYEELPIGQVKPLGWMLDQLTLEANGLAGHLFDFYRYVKDSPWLGGQSEYAALNEAAPYWYNGIVPLAYILGDERIVRQANKFLTYILDHQAPDGWLGPEDSRQKRGIWARCLLLMGMMNHAIADPAQSDKIVAAMHRYVALAHKMLKNDYEGYLEQPGDAFDHYGFGVARSHEFSVSLQWLYEYHPRGKEVLLWETMNLMWAGAEVAGKDWTTFFNEDAFNTGESAHDAPFEHGVTLAEALRNPAQFYRMTRNHTLLSMTYFAVNRTITHHGSLSGSIIADEYLGALNPQRGSELCMSIEMMYSMAYLYRLLGENSWADQAELAAFNALPAAVGEDWWSHQYVTQTNQPWSRRLEGVEEVFFNTNEYSQSFGLEPDYPCCTVNHVQGYPKFFQSSFVVRGTDTLVHQFLVPGKVTTKLPLPHAKDGDIVVTCTTNYPFSNTLSYTIDAATPFTFAIRVPGWALTTSTISINRAAPVPFTRSAQHLHEIDIEKGTTIVVVKLASETRVVERGEGAVALYRGALLFALEIESNVTSFPPRSYVSENHEPLEKKWTLWPLTQDHTIEPAPSAIWNIAIDPEQIVFHSLPAQSAASADETLRVEKGLPNPLWGRELGREMWMDVASVQIEWAVANGTPERPPRDVRRVGEPFWTRWVPYGSAKIHMAEVPRVRLERLEPVGLGDGEGEGRREEL